MSKKSSFEKAVKILNDGSTDQIEQIAQRLVSMPNNLVLRCARYIRNEMDGPSWKAFTLTEQRFLEKKGIAVIDRSRFDEDSGVGDVEFLEPWETMLKQVGKNKSMPTLCP